MTRGFVTIATGAERYYTIAANLLASYRHFSGNPMRFAIICESENEYTRLFDDAIVLNNPTCSYLDKLALLRYTPYDETIFIDADCLAYRDLNVFWEHLDGSADFTAFGKIYPSDYRHAWFKKDEVGEFADRIKFIPDFVGGVYFIRKTEKLEAFTDTCEHILENYHRYTFRQFTEPADEPVFALAMAVHDFRPADDSKVPICFYPHATKFAANILRGQVSYKSMFEPDERSWAYMVHWGSGNTLLPPYTIEAVKLQQALGKQGTIATNCKIACMKAAFQGKQCAKAILLKLHLLDRARDVRNSLRARSSR